ncbi:hypothetical protein D3C78_1819220 [compost metagenome]
MKASSGIQAVYHQRGRPSPVVVSPNSNSDQAVRTSRTMSRAKSAAVPPADRAPSHWRRRREPWA